jgi:hypothetical protein
LSKVQYNPKHKKVLDTFLLDNEFVKPGKMYGHPAYYIGGKLFASLYKEGVCIKIPELRVKELLNEDDFLPFQPMGRKMKEWIFIIHENSNEFLKDKPIFQESMEYVASLTNIQFKKKAS